MSLQENPKDALALLENIKLNKKGLSGTSTLTYFGSMSVTKKKVL
jgi:hypothetical protein